MEPVRQAWLPGKLICERVSQAMELVQQIRMPGRRIQERATWTLETLFQIANWRVLPCWLLLVLAPRWRWTYVVCSMSMPLVFGSLYAWLLSAGMVDGGFESSHGRC